MKKAESVTTFAMNQLQSNWSSKVQLEYEGLTTAKEIIRFLEDDRYCNNLGFVLARHLQEHYGSISGNICTVSIDDNIEKLSLLSSGFGAVVQEQECPVYARLLYALAKRNGLNHVFTQKVFLNYLTKKKTGLSRETCFQLSFAMGMDQDETCRFLEVMGQPPYSFRSAEECVFYCCQGSNALNNWDVAQTIIDKYNHSDSIRTTSDTEKYAGQTQNIEWMLILISEKIDSFESDEQKRNCILEFLLNNKQILNGFSLSANELFVKKLERVKSLLKVESDQEAAIAMWSPIWVQNSRKGRESGKEENEKPGIPVQYDFVPFRNLVNLPKTLYEKPLWRARIKKIRDFEVPVEKRDILFLSLMEWIWSGEECGGLENMLRFIYRTNEDLVKGGFSLIYPPNQYDRMILLSVCSEEPIDVLSDIFESAASEEEIERQITH